MAKRNTKARILETALILFNHDGEPNVSTNQIADELDISPGNLYYHFRSKNDIILDLFKIFLGRVEPLLSLERDAPRSAEDFWLYLHLLFEAIGEHRFLFRNLTDLMHRVPGLRHAMMGLIAAEKKVAHTMLQQLQENQALECPDLDTLTDNIVIGIIYWIPFADATDPASLDDGSALPKAVAQILALIVPWLREPERTTLNRLIQQSII